MGDFYIHPTAICESKNIGKNTRIWAFAHILKDVTVGEDCNLCDYTFVENGVSIGNRVTIKNGISIWNGVTIEDDVFLGPNCVLTNDIYPRSRVYHQENIKTGSEYWSERNSSLWYCIRQVLHGWCGFGCNKGCP